MTTPARRRPPVVPARTDVVVGFSIDMQLTRDDLAALSPDQIRVLIESTGQIAAIVNELRRGEDR